MRFLFLAMYLIPAVGFSQKLKVKEVDKFTKQQRLETERVTLKNRLGEGLAISLRSVDNSCYAELYGYGYGIGVVGDKAKLLFLLDNDSTVIGYSTGIQSYNIRSGTNTYNHQYSIGKEDLALLANHNVKSIRKYLSDGYADIDIPEKHQDDIRKLAALMIKELEQ